MYELQVRTSGGTEFDKSINSDGNTTLIVNFIVSGTSKDGNIVTKTFEAVNLYKRKIIILEHQILLLKVKIKMNEKLRYTLLLVCFSLFYSCDLKNHIEAIEYSKEFIETNNEKIQHCKKEIFNNIDSNKIIC